MRTSRPDLIVLAAGSVRGWHIALLFGISFLLSTFVAHLLLRDADALVRRDWLGWLWSIFTLLFFTIVTSCVPELRKLLADVMRGGKPANAGDTLLALGVLLAWGVGASPMLFRYPIWLFDQDTASRWFQLNRTGEPEPTLLFLRTMTAVLLAPLIEEIVFRGYLLNLWLARHRLWVAVWGASLSFGFWHFFTAPFATGMGVFLALVYLKYRSLILCMALHGLYNLLVQRMFLGQFVMHKERATVTSMASWSLELAVAIAFIPLAWLFWKRFRPQTESNS